MERLLLVDGSNLLFRMFYGMPARIVNTEGVPVHAVLGFTGALIGMLRMVRPTHALVVFDGQNGGARGGVLPGYKANRRDLSEAPDGENPYTQLGGVKQALDFMGIKHTESDGCEADDLIASYALGLPRGGGAVISSLDGDFFQLVSDRVTLMRYMGKRTAVFTPELVEKRFGVGPRLYADLRALTGDAADNIKGVEGVGVKTAASWLRQFGSLEGVLANAGEIKNARVREALTGGKERVLLNRAVIRLTGGQALPFGGEELACRFEGVGTREVLSGAGLL